MSESHPPAPSPDGTSRRERGSRIRYAHREYSYPCPLSKRLGLAQGWGRAILEQAIEPGESVRGVFLRLAEQHPAFYGVVLEPETAALLPHVTLLVNGQRLTTPEDYDAPLKDGAEIVLLPAYAGG